MKKIVFAIDDIGISGIVKVTNNLIEELLKTNEYDISVLCLSISDRSKVSSNVTVYDLDINKYGHRQRYLKLFSSLSAFFKSHQFDTLIICGMEFVPFYFLAAKKYLSNTKLVAWEHRNFNAGPLFRLEWFGKRIACRFFHHIVCLTNKDYDHYIDYDPDKEKIKRIYNISQYHVPDSSYNSESNQIITVGFLDYIKGYDMLVKVASIVYSKHKDWIWNIYGKGKEKESIEGLIKDYGLQNFVILKGFCDDMPSAYKNSSFYVMTSRSEGFPSVLLEAQRFHLPIISFDIECGPSDVIENDVNGFLIKPFDIDKMAEKILKLIEEPQKRINLSSNSLKYHQEFETDYIIKQWETIL